MAEADQFAVDAAVAPGRVLGGEAEDEVADLVGGSWASWPSRGMGPVFGDASAVPSQEGVGCDDPALASCAGSAAAMAPSSVRSSSLMAGLSICRRRIESWWRSTMISRSLERPERTASLVRLAMRRYGMRDAAGQPRPHFP